MLCLLCDLLFLKQGKKIPNESKKAKSTKVIRNDIEWPQQILTCILSLFLAQWSTEPGLLGNGVNLKAWPDLRLGWLSDVVKIWDLSAE